MVKIRKVFSSTAAYVVVAAGAIGLADAALPDPVWARLQVPAVLVALFGLLLTAALTWIHERGSREGAEAEEEPATPAREAVAKPVRKGIVVLPFDNISPDPSDAYFSDGLTEEIIARLSHIRSLRVISRSSAMVLKGTEKDVRTIGEELGVRYVLEGSVRKSGNDLRITAQLIDAADDAHLWAEVYQGVLDDVFGIQERVSRSLVGALNLALSSGESERLGGRPAGSFEAYDCYLRARHEIYRFTRESLESGIHTLRQGLELFPHHPLLLATLGEAYFVRYDWGMVREDWVLNRAEELARNALSRDPSLAQGKKLLGHLERYRGRVDRGCEYFLEAYRWAPDDMGILLHAAMSLAEVGWADLAAVLYRKLLGADPLSPFNYLMAALCEILRGHPDAGMELMGEFRSRASVVTTPMSAFLTVALFLADNREEAIQEIDRALAGVPDESHEWLLRFVRHVCRQEEEAALALLDEEAKALAWDDADLPLLMPAFFAQLGRTEEALEWMARALERGLINYPFFAHVGPFEDLRADPGFQELLGKFKRAWEASPIPRMAGGG